MKTKSLDVTRDMAFSLISAFTAKRETAIRPTFSYTDLAILFELREMYPEAFKNFGYNFEIDAFIRGEL